MDTKKAEDLLKWIAGFDFQPGQILYPENEAAILQWPKVAREALSAENHKIMNIEHALKSALGYLEKGGNNVEKEQIIRRILLGIVELEGLKHA